jgi:hypothetical protein
MPTTFDEWAFKVDALCRIHLSRSWAEVCGELPPLQASFMFCESPREFVYRWAEKYDLAWKDDESSRLWRFRLRRLEAE